MVPTCHPERKHKARGLCEPCYRKPLAAARYARDPEAGIQRVEAWRAKNPGKATQYHRTHKLKKYGLTLAEYAAKLDSQGGVCSICNNPGTPGVKSLSVDHNHNTGEVRDLLCQRCNTMVGMALERPDILRKGAEYLERFGSHGRS